VSEETEVRRAGRGDIPAIAALVQKATRSKAKLGEPEVMEWLFSKGLWVAIQHGARADSAEPSLVGVAGWQAENLLSVTDVFYVSPARLRSRVGRRLLETIEEEANVLMCEANVVLLPSGTPKATHTFLRQQGYEPKPFDTLHRIWREVLSAFVADETDLMVKQLRERMVMVPR
jgi:N-acetylglutamate synthase-like GNAT family acetyltransferase